MDKQLEQLENQLIDQIWERNEFIKKIADTRAEIHKRKRVIFKTSGSYKRIADRTGMSLKNTYAYKFEHKINRPPTLKEKIIKLSSKNIRPTDIAEQLGTSRGYVSQIRTLCGLNGLPIETI